MTINELSEKLNNCANEKCIECKFEGCGLPDCQIILIKELAKECKEIEVEEI